MRQRRSSQRSCSRGEWASRLGRRGERERECRCQREGSGAPRGVDVNSKGGARRPPGEPEGGERAPRVAGRGRRGEERPREREWAAGKSRVGRGRGVFSG